MFIIVLSFAGALPSMRPALVRGRIVFSQRQKRLLRDCLAPSQRLSCSGCAFVFFLPCRSGSRRATGSLVAGLSPGWTDRHHLQRCHDPLAHAKLLADLLSQGHALPEITTTPAASRVHLLMQ